MNIGSNEELFEVLEGQKHIDSIFDTYGRRKFHILEKLPQM